jgi:hypothetical protein
MVLENTGSETQRGHATHLTILARNTNVPLRAIILSPTLVTRGVTDTLEANSNFYWFNLARVDKDRLEQEWENSE